MVHYVKPRPNDRNISTRVAIVWPRSFDVFNILRAENRTIAYGRVQHCCTNLTKRLQHHATSTNLTIFKFEPTTPPTSRNTSQHAATGWPNARNMLRPTMLQYVALKCCDRLVEALHISQSRTLKSQVECMFGLLEFYNITLVLVSTHKSSVGRFTHELASLFCVSTQQKTVKK